MTILSFMLVSTYFVSAQGQTRCGNGVLEDGEQCEGGDVLKCKDCIIQDGFMCPDAVRDTDFQNVLGKKVALKDNNGVETLMYVIDPATNNSMPETCLGELLCTSDLYSPVNDEVTVPYKGYHCPTVCKKNPVPEWFEYKESVPSLQSMNVQMALQIVTSTRFLKKQPTARNSRRHRVQVRV